MRIFSTVLVMACCAACGNNTIFPTAPIYSGYSSVSIPSGKIVMGGAIQGAPLPLVAKNKASIVVSTIAGSAGSLGIANGVDTTSRFGIVNGITTDGTNLYMTDFSNHTIRKMDHNGMVTTIAGVPGVAGISDTNPTLGIAAGFYFPSGITTDGVKNGRTNLYVVDCYNNTIRKVSFSNNSTSIVSVTTIAGTAGLAGSVDAAVGTSALFNRPTDITTDGKNLYVTDSSSLTIRKISMAYPYGVTTIAGAPDVGGWTDGVGVAARFQYPARITTDGSFLYVTDFISNTIRRIDPPSGMVTTIAGTPGVTGSADGIGAAASFSNVNGITSDGTNLYVTDSNNNTVRKVVRDPSTGKWVVTTIAGTAGAIGPTDGSGAAALFKFPVGITTDGTSLYVTDSNNYTIRKITSQ